MKLRRLEIAVIALTLAFICFMGGYYSGRRGAVNIVSVSSAAGGTQTLRVGGTANESAAAALSSGGVAAPEAQAAAPSGGENAAADALAPAGAPRDSDGRININSASASELTDLPGIGDVIAGRIVEYRLLNGPFASIEDIRNVSGIGAKKFEDIMDRITVG